MDITDYEEWRTKYNSLVDAYREESDRAAAILAGSFLEAFLEAYLRRLLVEDPEHVNGVFSGFGPLATMAAKVDVLYGLGFVSPVMQCDLRYIRKIRNHFAHHPEVTAFDSSPVRDLASHLSTAKPLERTDGIVEEVESPRDRYLLAIGANLMKLYIMYMRQGGRATVPDDEDLLVWLPPAEGKYPRADRA